MNADLLQSLCTLLLLLSPLSTCRAASHGLSLLFPLSLFTILSVITFPLALSLSFCLPCVLSLICSLPSFITYDILVSFLSSGGPVPISFPFPSLSYIFSPTILSFQTACTIFIQGSGWVKGSAVALSSSSSTPSRGRRQLPQTPLTPRPGVAYKTANSSPVHCVSNQAPLSPSRLSRGLSEHNALQHSHSRHFPCPVTRISSEPFLGQDQDEALGSLYGSLRDQLDVFQDAASLMPTPHVGRSPRTDLPHMMGALLPAPQQNLGVPNGYHFSFGGSTSRGSGVRAPRYYQEAEEDEWC